MLLSQLTVTRMLHLGIEKISAWFSCHYDILVKVEAIPFLNIPVREYENEIDTKCNNQMLVCKLQMFVSGNDYMKWYKV